jgi:hypothetical protein
MIDINEENDDYFIREINLNLESYFLILDNNLIDNHNLKITHAPYSLRLLILKKKTMTRVRSFQRIFH